MSMPAEKVVKQREKLSSSSVDLEGIYQDYVRRKKMIAKNRALTLSIILAAIIWAWIETNFSILYLFSGASNIFTFLFTDLLPPDFSAISMFIMPALDTIYMSYVGMIVSVVFSLFFGVLAAKNTTFHPLLGFTSRSVISFLRAVPAIVWGIILVSAIGLGPFAGTIAIGLSGIGILGKAYADLIEEIDMGQVEAVRSTGAAGFK
ncbi:ABC transporter permease subunit [Thalassobacillus sp. C254]|uniref:ABC transporter permease subunit n=1 Tax=Thalassobacillus sp. C254 TaxID=1225341 RepID=UPI0006CF7E7C|nr:ABC transporter permease subunit [Thalassobacillus sp. C254]